jgi:hypothetical protein
VESQTQERGAGPALLAAWLCPRCQGAIEGARLPAFAASQPPGQRRKRLVPAAPTPHTPSRSSRELLSGLLGLRAGKSWTVSEEGGTGQRALGAGGAGPGLLRGPGSSSDSGLRISPSLSVQPPRNLQREAAPRAPPDPAGQRGPTPHLPRGAHLGRHPPRAREVSKVENPEPPTSSGHESNSWSLQQRQVSPGERPQGKGPATEGVVRECGEWFEDPLGRPVTLASLWTPSCSRSRPSAGRAPSVLGHRDLCEYVLFNGPHALGHSA